MTLNRHTKKTIKTKKKKTKKKKKTHTKNTTNFIIARLKSETRGKLINRIPGLRLSISSLPGSAFRMHVELLGKPRDVNKRSQSLAW